MARNGNRDGRLTLGRIEDILRSRIAERCGARAVPDDIRLDVRPGIGTDGFEISDDHGGVRITGNDERGLLYGVGRFLRTSWRGRSVPAKPVRGIYFATHFHNYYHNAPVDEIERYVEDLALWGINAISVWFDMHHYTGIDTPEAQADVTRLRSILQAARGVGMGVGLTTLSNEAYASSPEHLRAGWDGPKPLPAHYHVEICPSKPGAIDLELKWRSEVLDAFADIGVDYLWLWPYDQGGCNCDDCAPWGANGFLRISEPVARMYRARFPQGKVVLSTWYFDRFTEGEWEGLDEAFRRNPPDWVDYLMADNHGLAPFPPYPLEHGVPGGLPMLSFPEISMHANQPWGGYGANPYVRRLQGIWDGTKSHLAGGFPYSEGIYEDINKVICAQLQWEPDRPADEIVREYAAYHFSPDVADMVSRAIDILDRNLGHSATKDGEGFQFTMGGTEGVDECLALMREADAMLPEDVRSSWRWRVLFLRALIDSELASNGLRATPECEAAFRELARIYHVDEGTLDWVRPVMV